MRLFISFYIYFSYFSVNISPGNLSHMGYVHDRAIANISDVDLSKIATIASSTFLHVTALFILAIILPSGWDI